MITYRYLDFMAKPATVPRDRLIKTFTTYLSTPRGEKRTGGIPFVEELKAEEANTGLSIEDSTRILMIILWGINSNVQMTAFWMMAHIMRPDVADEIEKETSPIMAGIQAAARDEAILDELPKGRYMLDKCPLLNLTFNEVIRVASTGSSVHEVMHPITLDRKVLPRGMKALLPQRRLLLTTEAFGADAEEMDCYRFVKNKSLARHEYYRLFGGGVTLCSGRIIGKYEVLVFVVLTLWRYEMRFVKPGETALGVKGKPFPRIDKGKPSLGISKQVEGDDMIVEVTRRKV